jgi:ABC-2 type transport system permease protein
VTAQLRSELLKIRSTRTVLGLTLCLLAFVVFLVIVSVYAQSTSDLFTSDQQRDLLSVAGLAEPFAAIVGILAVTSEFRHGTARPTFLAEPRRWHVIAAKAVAGFAAGLGLALIVLVVAYLLTRLGFWTRGIDFVVEGDRVARLALGIALASALWGALGVGVGAIVRSQVGAIVGVLVWLFVAEQIVFGLVPSVGRWLPGHASDTLSGSTGGDLLSPVAGGFLFAAYAALACVLGALTTEKRDVG